MLVKVAPGRSHSGGGGGWGYVGGGGGGSGVISSTLGEICNRWVVIIQSCPTPPLKLGYEGATTSQTLVDLLNMQ